MVFIVRILVCFGLGDWLVGFFFSLCIISKQEQLTLSIRHISNNSRARRAAKEAKEAPAQPAPEKVKVEVKKFVKIGRPGYKGGRFPARTFSFNPLVCFGLDQMCLKRHQNCSASFSP